MNNLKSMLLRQNMWWIVGGNEFSWESIKLLVGTWHTEKRLNVIKLFTVNDFPFYTPPSHSYFDLIIWCQQRVQCQRSVSSLKKKGVYYYYHLILVINIEIAGMSTDKQEFCIAQGTVSKKRLSLFSTNM